MASDCQVTARSHSSDLPVSEVPSDNGIHVVVRASGTAPVFLATSTAW
ncbi:hypothetical protein M2271_002085 [Streptomyces sp. LBL]|nr:hypothetical protein [Streptomyces sp. LBL]